jgi:hypothetical protein
MIIYNGGIMNKLKLSQENKKKKKKHMCISWLTWVAWSNVEPKLVIINSAGKNCWGHDGYKCE